MISSEFKGAIFDLDGTLVDTEGTNLQAWNEALKPFEKFLSRQDYLNYVGRSGSIVGEELIKKYSLDAKTSLFSKKKEILIERLEEGDIKLMPSAKEAIEFFVKNDFKLAVATGSSAQQTELKLKKTKFYSYFPIVVTASDVERGKPHPDIYLLVLEKIRLKAQDCFAFEDTQYGLEAAKAAGLTCFVIPNEYSRKQDFSKADKIFSSLEEAIKFIKL